MNGDIDVADHLAGSLHIALGNGKQRTALSNETLAKVLGRRCRAVRVDDRGSVQNSKLQ